MPGEDNRKNCYSITNTRHGTNVAQRTLNGRWCQYDTKDIKCQVMPVIDVVSVVMARAILATPDL